MLIEEERERDRGRGRGRESRNRDSDVVRDGEQSRDQRAQVNCRRKRCKRA